MEKNQETAYAYTVSTIIVSYGIAVEDINNGEVTIGFYRNEKRVDKDDGKETSYLMFKKPLSKIPKKWLNGFELNVNFHFCNGKLDTSKTQYIIKTVAFEKQLYPMFNSDGTFSGAKKLFILTKNCLGKKVEKSEFTISFYPYNSEETRLVMGYNLLIHNSASSSKARIVTEEIKQMLGYTLPYKLRAEPVYFRGHFAGAILKYGTFQTWGYECLFPKEFSSLPE